MPTLGAWAWHPIYPLPHSPRSNHSKISVASGPAGFDSALGQVVVDATHSATMTAAVAGWAMEEWP